VPQHIGAIALLDTADLPGGRMDLDAVRTIVAGAVEELPWLRWVPSAPRGMFGRPRWQDKGPADLAVHVLDLDVPAPGDRSALEALVATRMAEPLPRDRPLWRLELLQGLDGSLGGSQAAVLLRMHHAMADGLGVLALAMHLMDDRGARRTRPRTPASQSGEPGRGVGPRARGAEARRGRTGAVLVGGGLWHLARVRGQWVATAPACKAAPEQYPGEGGSHFGTAELSLATLRRAKRATGLSTSELVLAALAEALSGERELRPPAPRDASVVAMVPLTTRRAEPGRGPGNWTTAFPVRLPIGDMRAGERRVAVRAAASFARESGQPAAAEAVMRWLGWLLPTRVHGWASRATYRGRFFDLIVSTLPGPVSPPVFSGARLVRTYPILPLAPDVHLSVGAMQWGRSLALGITTQGSAWNASRLAVRVAGVLCELGAPEQPETDGLAQGGPAAEQPVPQQAVAERLAEEQPDSDPLAEARGEQLLDDPEVTAQVLPLDEPLTGLREPGHQRRVGDEIGDGPHEVVDAIADDREPEPNHDGGRSPSMSCQGVEGDHWSS
jgi:WS/DGAT/MGAT family acyltransferase